MTDQIALQVNGTWHRTPSGPYESLLEFLRKELGLTGAKNACDGSGTCGACTVLIDGVARKSCQVALDALDGASVITIEGLGEDGLHPIQQAFVAYGAVQCGYCTPGMILATKALLDATPHPTRGEIVHALRGNLCRCTGYAKIIEAIEALVDHGSAPALCLTADIGAPLRRTDAASKATGRIKYADDQHRHDDLVLKVVWAAEEHAEILGIDTTKACNVPGVVDVLTAVDVPGTNAYGLIHCNQPVLCEKRVRFLGDPVALVIAENEQAEEEGAGRVTVDYKVLPVVLRSEEALATDAPRIHPGGNLCCEVVLEHGRSAQELEASHTCVAGRFETPAVEHAYLEPEAGFAEWVDGITVVSAANQYPETVRDQLADVLGVSKAEVRVISPPAGGAFGGKTDISVHALLAIAAWHTKRRVRLTWSRAESLRASVKRHAMVMDYRIGFSAQGEIRAIEADIVANAGAYESLSHPLLEQTAAFSTGPYRIPSVRVRVRGAYTNTPTAAAFRGFGIPQPTFAVESLLDEGAHKLGLSPIEIRRRNALKPGDRSATGQVMQEDTHILEAIEALQPAYDAIRDTLGPDEGVGIACGYKNVGLGLGEDDYAIATMRAQPDGRLIVRVGAVEIGQGSETVLGQLAAEKLGVPAQKVTVRWGDTGVTPDGRETNASRQTVVSGNAVLEASEALAEALSASAASLFPELPGPFRYDRGLVSEGGERRDWEVICSRLTEPVEVSSRYVAPATLPLAPWDSEPTAELAHYFAYTFFANLAHVAIDREQGHTTVRRLISAYDVGRVINRQAAEGQIEGGALMGMGFALSESYWSHGERPTTSLARCNLLRAPDLPKLETIFVETEDSVGPHGCKGLGEVAMIAVAPSVTNAIHDALGVRVTQLPATPANLRNLLGKRTEEGTP